MKNRWYVMKEKYTEIDYHRYRTYLPENAVWARERLIDFLNEEFSVEHTLYAELDLRDLLQFDDYHKNSPWNVIDYQSCAMVWYREALVVRGQDAADDSLLLGLRLYQNDDICIIDGQ